MKLGLIEHKLQFDGSSASPVGPNLAGIPTLAVTEGKTQLDPTWLAPAAKTIAAIAILIAISCLGGWVFEIDFLKRLNPGLDSMKVNTAIGLTLGGFGQLVSMQIHANQRRDGLKAAKWSVALLGCIVLTIGTLTLLEHETGVDIGIDNLLIRDSKPIAGVIPGRMSIATALALVTVGLTLITQQMIFTWLTLSISGFTLICYLLDIYELNRHGAVNMALSSSVAFILLGAAHVMSRPDRGVMQLLLASGLGGAMARTMLPVAICAPIAVSWLAAFSQRNGILDSNFAAALAAILGIVLLVIVVFTTARVLAATDQRRRHAEQELRLSHDALEAKVRMRTEELRQARDEANSANRHKSVFLAHMSHELRTPLNAILGFADIMRREQFGSIGQPRYAEYADDIHNSGSHLLALINDILDLSKIEAGKYDFLPQQLDVGVVVRACHDLVAGLAKDRHLRFLMEVDPHLPPLTADERAIKQILINLLSNSIKFTPDGGTVTLTVTPIAPATGEGGPQYLAFTVSDTGIGMTEAEIVQAQTPFGQIQNQFSRTHKGTGLGLFLAKQLTELQAGYLEIQSTPGLGTTVRVSFPIVSTAIHRTGPSRASA